MSTQPAESTLRARAPNAADAIATADSSVAPALRGASAHEVSVLIVDDLPANLLALEAVLGPLGYTLIRAQSGEEALERARERDFAAILLDVRMRGLDGLETASLIKRSQRNRTAPIIFLTADGPSDMVMTAAYAQGAADFLTKPFSPEMLRSKVRVFADLFRAREEVKRQAELLRAREAEAFAMLVGDVGKALSGAKNLNAMLDSTCQAMVKHVDAAFARVWILNDAEDVLELRASAGMYTHLDGAHARVPLGKLKIGLIAQERRPHLTNDVQTDPRIGDHEWARREGMVSFVGHPLLVDDELVGVAALFARRELGRDVFDGVASVCDMIALGVSRYRADEQRKQLYLTQRMRAAQMRALADAALAINTASDVHGVLQVIADRAALLIGTHQAVVTLIGSEKEPSLRATHLSDQYALFRAESGLPESTGVCLGIDRLPEPVRLTHAELLADERYAELERTRKERVPMRGWLAAPLLGRGNAQLGSIQLSDKLAGGEFSEDDVRVLGQLAQLSAVALENMQLTARMAAIAMDNARLFQDAQKLIRALERSNAELDQFAYVASHDLKAPLRGIANLAQWLEEDMGEAITEPAREQLDLLKSRVHRMEGLINGILDYSRAGRMHANPEPVHVGRLVAEVVELLAPADGTVRVGEDMPVVVTERVPLQQVFMNLIGNALKHAKRGDPSVQVDAREEGWWHQFSITDNGPGIAREFHDKIWAIFQTLEPRDVVEGTGIGLSVVKKIVEGKGGRVWVESVPGAGATFRFTWPKTEKGGAP
jgi:signal transduction histidine kinase/FixJ family two-component response regulator